MPRRVRTITPGVRARVHTGIVWSIAAAARPFRFRGVQRLSWELTRILSADNIVEVTLEPGTKIRLPLGDGYWTKLLNKDYMYEEEVAKLLKQRLVRPTYFIDCGANIGYWSLLVRAKAWHVIAIEANPRTYSRLEENVRLNSADVTMINAALWHAGGEAMNIVEEPRKHAGASVASATEHNGPGAASGEVMSTTWRSIIETHCPDSSLPILVKLDVEGAEIAAIRGAGDILARREISFIYEDHASDPTCAVSRFVQSVGMAVVDPESGNPLTIEEIARSKVLPWKGYNYFAYFPEPPTSV